MQRPTIPIRRRPAARLAPLLLTLAAGHALAQADPFDPPEPPAQDDPASPSAIDPLRGPSVAGEQREVAANDGMMMAMADESLVRIGYTGRLQRLEVLPEHAALDLLPLTPAERSAVDEAVAGYTARFDALLARNIATINQLQAAAGNPRQSLGPLMTILRQVRQLERDGTLAELIADALPTEPANLAERFESLVAEYNTALRNDIIAEAEGKGERLSPWQARVRARLYNLGIAAKQSFDRQLGGGDDRVQRLLLAVEATPEQSQAIQAILQDYVGERIAAGDFNDPDAQVELFHRIMAELTPAQRGKALRSLASGEGM